MKLLFMLLALVSLNTFATPNTESFVAWQPVQNAVAYKVCWSETTNSLATCSADITTTSYQITPLNFNKVFYVGVKAKDASGNYSPFSTQLSANTISVNGSFSKTTTAPNSPITITPITTGPIRIFRLDTPGSVEATPRFWTNVPTSIQVTYATPGSYQIGFTGYKGLETNPSIQSGATNQNVNATVTVDANCQ